MRRAFVLCFALVAGCAAFQDVDTSVQVLTLQPQPPAMSRADTEIALRAISFQDMDANKGLLVKLSWQENAHNQASRQPSGSVEVVTGVAPVLPLPSFAVHIGNHSAQPLDFTKAQFALVDDKGKRWPIYKDGGELTGRVWGDVVIRFPALNGRDQQQESIGNIIFKLPMLDHSTVVAANTDFDGFLSFKMDARLPDELEKYLASVQKLTVEITNVGPDGASFTVPLVEGKGQLLVTCTGNKPPTVDKCRQRPFTQ